MVLVVEATVTVGPEQETLAKADIQCTSVLSTLDSGTAHADLTQSEG